MRNWNDKIISVFPVSPLVTSLPMRNWNCETVALRDLFPAVTSLPMRNWNYARRIFICPAIGLPAYLWGIETILVLFFFTEPPMLPAYLWGIETVPSELHLLWLLRVTSLPMRNWNPVRVNTRAISAPSYQPTYEELKLSYVRSEVIPVRRLPAYLWGIETGSVVHRIK